jgi:hypothetical protein
MRLGTIGIWAIISLLGGTAIAQTAGTGGSGSTPDPVESEVADATTYAPVGDVLANAVLGNTDLQPIQPGSLKTLLTAVQAFDQNGALAPGVALEVTPWNFGVGHGLTLEQYRGSYLVRTLKYFSASFATAKQGSVATATTSQPSYVQSAAALRLRIWDDTDWRMNQELGRCALDAAQRYLDSQGKPPAAPPTDPGIVQTHDVSDTYKNELATCQTQHALWNAKQLAVGGAFVFDSPDGQLRGTGKDKGVAWGSIAGGPGIHWLFEGSVRYTYHFANALSAPSVTDSSQVLGTAFRITWAVNSTLTLRVNSGVGRAWHAGSSFWEIPIGLLSQLKIADGTWLEAGFTNTWQTSEQPGSIGFVTNFKWIYDITPTPVLPAPPSQGGAS